MNCLRIFNKALYILAPLVIIIHFQDGTCGYDPAKRAPFTVQDCKKFNAGDEKLMRDVVGVTGPIAVSFSTTDGFRFYKNGRTEVILHSF